MRVGRGKWGLSDAAPRSPDQLHVFAALNQAVADGETWMPE